MRRGRSATLTLVLALGLAAAAAHAALAAVSTNQVSVTRRGGDPPRSSSRPSISADGRYVAFASAAGDLVEGDRNGLQDIFVRDLVTGISVRTSVDTGGGDPNGTSEVPSISADGRYVAFDSLASDLVIGDTNGTFDVFVRDLVAGTTVRASLDMGGGDPDGASNLPSISADGRYVAFHSLASDLVIGDGNGNYDVYVRELVAGTTVRASVDTRGGDPNDGSLVPSISADGRYVAFQSLASDLVNGDGNGTYDVYVRDLIAGTTVRASVDTGGGDPNGLSILPSVSGDGRYVAFSSSATDLVQGDGNDTFDVYVRDLVAGTTIRVSVDTAGRDSNEYSARSSISGDGRYVAFDSSASDLVHGDGNDLPDIFVRDLRAGTTVRVSVDTGGGDPDGQSVFASISAEGKYVAFDSYASDLVVGHGDRKLDVFAARLS
jgi:Tol biopolymer transport system component